MVFEASEDLHASTRSARRRHPHSSGAAAPTLRIGLSRFSHLRGKDCFRENTRYYCDRIQPWKNEKIVPRFRHSCGRSLTTFIPYGTGVWCALLTMAASGCFYQFGREKGSLPMLSECGMRSCMGWGRIRTRSPLSPHGVSAPVRARFSTRNTCRGQTRAGEQRLSYRGMSTSLGLNPSVQMPGVHSGGLQPRRRSLRPCSHGGRSTVAGRRCWSTRLPLSRKLRMSR